MTLSRFVWCNNFLLAVSVSTLQPQHSEDHSRVKSAEFSFECIAFWHWKKLVADISRNRYS